MPTPFGCGLVAQYLLFFARRVLISVSEKILPRHPDLIGTKTKPKRSCRRPQNRVSPLSRPRFLFHFRFASLEEATMALRAAITSVRRAICSSFEKQRMDWTKSGLTRRAAVSYKAAAGTDRETARGWDGTMTVWPSPFISEGRPGRLPAGRQRRALHAAEIMHGRHGYQWLVREQRWI